MRIEGGTGNGYAAKVDSENRLFSDCITRSAERHANEDHGEAYHVLFSQSPTANDDCIFYMTNNSETRNLIVEGIWLYVSAASTVTIKLGDKGTRGSATTLTPVNCNAGSGNTADGTFEKGADLESGTLTGGSTVEMYTFTAAATSKFFNFEQDIILPKNQTLTIYSSLSTATVTGTVVFNCHEKV